MMKILKKLKLIAYLKRIPKELWIVLFLDSTAELLLLNAARVTETFRFVIFFGSSFALGIISWLVWQSLNVRWHK